MSDRERKKERETEMRYPALTLCLKHAATLYVICWQYPVGLPFLMDTMPWFTEAQTHAVWWGLRRPTCLHPSKYNVQFRSSAEVDLPHFIEEHVLPHFICEYVLPHFICEYVLPHFIWEYTASFHMWVRSASFHMWARPASIHMRVYVLPHCIWWGRSASSHLLRSPQGGY